MKIVSHHTRVKFASVNSALDLIANGTRGACREAPRHQ
jgi:hypothetical protein